MRINEFISGGAVDRLVQILLLVGSDGSILDVNPTALEQYGYSREEMLALTIRDICAPEDQRDIEGQMREAAERGVLFEARHRRADGTTFPVEVRSVLVTIHDESALLSMVNDVTERRLADDARSASLRFVESMDRVNQAIQGAADLEQMTSDVLDVVLSDLDADRAWLFYPCDPDASSFSVPMEVARPEYPGAGTLSENVPMPPDMAANLREALESAGPITYLAGTERPINTVSAEQFGVQSMMMIALRPKSRRPWAFGLHQCSYPRVWTSEEKRLFEEIGRRLSDALTSLLYQRDLKEREREYRTLLHKIRAAVVVHGPDTEIQTSNPMAQDLLGLTEDQLLGKTAIDSAWHFFREDGTVMPREEYPVAKVAATHQALRDYVVGVHRPDRDAESDVWVLVNADPVFDHKGELAQVVVTFVDITRRKRAEEALRDSEHKLAVIFDSIPDGIVVTAVASGRIVEANEGLLEMAGLTREQALGKTTTELSLWVDAEDRRRFREHVRRDGAVRDFETTFRRASGDIFPGVISSTVVDVGGEPCSLVLVRDVTERKRAEEALHETEERFETVFRASPVCISLSRLSDGLVLDVNDAFLKLVGLGRTDVVGRPIDEIAVRAESDDRRRMLTELVECGHASSSEVEYLIEDGEPRRLLEVAELVEIAGEPCVLDFAQDIGDLVRARDAVRESEAQYRAVVETSPDGFWVADSEGRILEVNDAYARRSGYSRDELVGMHIVDLDAKLSPSEIAELVDTTMEVGGQIFETAHRTKTGDVWPIEVCVSYWPTLGGRHFMFIRDIGKRKRAELLAEIRTDLVEIEQSADIDTLLRAALDKAELITGSSIGFFHFVSNDHEHLDTQMLSTNTLAVMRVAEGGGRHRALSEAGVWAECVKTRAPVIHNSYDSLPNRKRLPSDHAPLVRELVVPIVRAGKVVAIVGVGNKSSDYTQDDVNDVDTIASMVADLALRRRTQDEFEHFFNLVPDMVCVISSDGSFHRLNPAWERVLGYTQSELLGEPLLGLVHPEDLEEATAHFEIQLHEPIAMVGYANRCRAKDGTYRWLEWNVAPIAGEFRFAAARDITRRKVDEERLARYQTRLRALAAELASSAERERGRLGVELHDGLGQMLTAAKMTAQSIAAEPLESPAMEQAQKLVELLGESIGEVRLLTSDLAPTVLFELGLGAALLWLRDRYQRLYGLKCVVRMDEKAKRSRSETAMFVFRAVREALNNVVRHSHVMRATVTIGRIRGSYRVTISDRGVGFDPALIDEPGEIGGFGLFSIREECLSMGGTMEVQSEPGHGTRIRVCVPDTLGAPDSPLTTPPHWPIP